MVLVATGMLPTLPLSAVRPGGYHRCSARTSPRVRKLAKKTGLARKPCVPRCCCRCRQSSVVLHRLATAGHRWGASVLVEDDSSMTATAADLRRPGYAHRGDANGGAVGTLPACRCWVCRQRGVGRATVHKLAHTQAEAAGDPERGWSCLLCGQWIAGASGEQNPVCRRCAAGSPSTHMRVW